MSKEDAKKSAWWWLLKSSKQDNKRDMGSQVDRNGSPDQRNSERKSNNPSGGRGSYWHNGCEYEYDDD